MRGKLCSPEGGSLTKKMGKLFVARTGPPGIETPRVQTPSACTTALPTTELSTVQAVSPAGLEQTAGVEL